MLKKEIEEGINSDLLTIKEAARYSRLSRATLYNYLSEGAFRSYVLKRRGILEDGAWFRRARLTNFWPSPSSRKGWWESEVAKLGNVHERERALGRERKGLTTVWEPFLITNNYILFCYVFVLNSSTPYHPFPRAQPTVRAGRRFRGGYQQGSSGQLETFP
jgi:hypothetical protein